MTTQWNQLLLTVTAGAVITIAPIAGEMATARVYNSTDRQSQSSFQVNGGGRSVTNAARPTRKSATGTALPAAFASFKDHVLANLSLGWRGPGSIPPLPAVLDRVEELTHLVNHVSFALDLTPLGDGGVHFEWRHSGWDYSAEVASDGSMFLYRMDDATEDDESREIDFDAQKLAKFIKVGQFD